MRAILLFLILFQLAAFAQEAEPTDRVFHHQAVVLNSSPAPIFVKVVPKKEVMELKGGEFELPGNSSAVIGHYTYPDGFVSSVEVMTVTGSTRNRKGKPVSVSVLMMEKKQVDDTHITYFYHVLGGSGGVGFTF